MAEEENIQEIDEETNISLDDEIKTQKVSNDKNSNEDQLVKKKKIPILNKILFSVVGFLFLTLILGTILFFMGFFQSEEIKIKETPKEEKISVKTNSFNIKDINSKKLNKQLLLLTNKNIIQEEEINKREKEEEAKKIKREEEKKKKEALALEEEKLTKEKENLENKKIELQKQKEELELLKNQAIALRDEMINNKEEIEKNKNKVVQVKPKIKKEVAIIKEDKDESLKEKSEFVSLINVAKIKGELYKSYLDRITNIYSDIKLCRDDLNRIEIYYGPFKDDKKRSEIYKKLQENGIINSYEVELTKEEFSKRCKY